MRYLLGTAKFIWLNDDGEEAPFMIGEEVKHAGSVVETLYEVAKMYIPLQNQMLNLNEIDQLMKAKRILRKPPNDGAYHRFETEDWNVLVKAIKWVLPLTNAYFISPNLTKILDAVKEATEPPVGKTPPEGS